MTDKPATPVSMSKGGTPSGSDRPTPPRSAVLAAGALVLCAVAALVAALSMQTAGVKRSILHLDTVANDKVKGSKHLTAQQLVDQLDKTVKYQLFSAVVLVLVLGFLAVSIFRGRYWARWATVGVILISTVVVQTPAGLFSLLTIGIDVSAAYKIPAFLAGLFSFAALVLVNLRPSIVYLNLTKPARPAGAPQRRGLFAPRPAGGAAPRSRFQPRTPAATEPAATRPANQPDRSRSKQRANSDAVAKGAELARTRAKASKSRRTGA